MRSTLRSVSDWRSASWIGFRAVWNASSVLESGSILHGDSGETGGCKALALTMVPG